MAGDYQLSSSQTALALVLPDELSQDVNVFRSQHDKAFKKWPAHINILYPFVPIHKFESALQVLQNSLLHDFQGPLDISCDDLDVFRHSRSVTLFLQPDESTTQRLGALRKLLTSALGCDETDATHDGEFRPHLTLGQSETSENAVAALTAKAQQLRGLKWSNIALTALRRDGPGRSMTVFKTIPFGQRRSISTIAPSHMADWSPCFEFMPSFGWQPISSINEGVQDPKNILVTSINIMEEDYAPQFSTRLPIIVRAIDRLQYTAIGTTRVLCLQEVSPKTLPLILDNPTIRKLYPFSTHCEASLLPNIRNQMVLSSHPFLQFELSFAERHKSVLLVQFVGSQLTVANIHLSSGFTTELIETKRRQMSKLSAFLERRKIIRHTILAGDFNLPTSSRTLQAAVAKRIVTIQDIRKAQTEIITAEWEDAFSVAELPKEENIDGELAAGEEGATFDKTNNPLAALKTASIDRRPQRYDRILTRGDGALQAQRYFMAKLFSNNGQFASDHYGISAVYCYDENSVGSDTVVRRFSLPMRRASPLSSEAVAPSDVVQVIVDDTDISSYMKADLPREDEVVRRSEALNLLRNILKYDCVDEIALDAIGSYAMGTWLRTSDIDILASGEVSSSQFFQQALHSLREHGCIAHFIDAKVQRLETELEGIHLDIQYRKRDSMKIQDLKAHNTQRDTEYIMQTIPSLESFKLAQRFIMILLRRRGLCGAKFGYFGSIHITLMLNRLLKLTDHSNALTPASIVRMFFNHYSTFEWSRPISDPKLAHENTGKMSDNSAIYIRSLFTPATRLNVAESCTIFAVRHFANELSIVDKALSLGHWRDCLRPQSDSVSNFLNRADSFLQVQLDFWSLSTTSAELVRGITGLIESRLVHVPAKLADEYADEIDVQIWPARFKLAEIDNESRGFYLIGVSGRLLDGEDDRVVIDTRKLGQVATSLSNMIQRCKPWNPAVAGLQCSVMTKKRTLEQGLVLDNLDWTRLAAPDSAIIPESETNEQKAAEVQSSRVTDLTFPPAAPTASSTASLRPVQDIIARLNHDGDSYDVNDFLVGYDDRFAGTMEIPLSAWKRDATHEEFIPLHRIVWIRSKDDFNGGQKIWDRHTRLDLVFGSGRPQI